MRNMILVFVFCVLFSSCASTKFFTKCEQIGKGVWKNCEEIEQ